MKILITGATSGIGRQLALDYHAAGHEVWALGRDRKALAELGRAGFKTGAVDLMDREATMAWFSRLEVIDLAILSAGSCEYIDMPAFDSALLSRVMRVNVESMAALTALRRLAPGLILSPASGDDLAQRLGLRHYPVLITATGVEQ